MATWFGLPVRECECGFTTPDGKEFERHLTLKRHKAKAEPEQKQAKAAKKETKTESGEAASERSNNG